MGICPKRDGSEREIDDDGTMVGRRGQAHEGVSDCVDEIVVDHDEVDSRPSRRVGDPKRRCIPTIERIYETKRISPSVLQGASWVRLAEEHGQGRRAQAALAETTGVSVVG